MVKSTSPVRDCEIAKVMVEPIDHGIAHGGRNIIIRSGGSSRNKN
jgi:hypothetical protein